MPTPIALLLDVDGTILDLAPRPELVTVSDDLRRLLGDLHVALDSALALVSGRPIDALDDLFTPFRSAAAGLHGVELRTAASAPVRMVSAQQFPPTLLDAVTQLAAATPATFVEDKAACVAVHHRLQGEDRIPLRRSLQRAIDESAPGWNMIDGHHVFEIKPAGVDKGSACRTLLAEPSFRGRLPVYLGDDTTDLDAFAAVAALGGRCIAVGPRIAAHGHRHLPTPGAARSWLDRMLAALRQSGAEVEALLASSPPRR